MQSDGGLTPMDKFNGSRAILSGPAGGVVGYAVTTYKRETDLPVIGFDMGGKLDLLILFSDPIWVGDGTQTFCRGDGGRGWGGDALSKIQNET